ncbi:MAG: DUF3365 domain-containing protein [Chloroflexi bacterium]|nr:MAG: DUF3365 domain-containing protein [Chloroflexota bacterium]
MFRQLQGLSIRTKIMIPLGAVIVLALGSVFFWMAVQQESQIIEQINAQAKSVFQQIVLLRAWVAGHGEGGVYVEKTKGVETNPYLKKIKGLAVDLETTNGRQLTLQNPALVTKELSDLAAKRGQPLSFNITSLNPLNPDDAPSEWEARALRQFEEGDNLEFSAIETENGQTTFHYMAPLFVTESCLQCHAQQGYKLGDIRGGISVSIPMAEAQAAIVANRWRLLFAGVGITGLVLVLVYIVVNVLVINPLQEVEETARQISEGRLDQRVPLHANDELGSLAASFNTMTEQLSRSLASSEHLVAERTRRLETAASLAEKFSAILDLDTLLLEAVNQIKDTFGYYHAHIYLLDDAGQNLVLAEGAGQAGREMKLMGHSISLAATKSLVARAARTGQVVSVDNVRQADDWLPNPQLPHTYSEIAVPVKYGETGQVLGVLDVQQDKIAGLDEADASLLRSLAGQIAVAVNNARLFKEVEVALANAKSAQERYRVQSWDSASFADKLGRYSFTRPNTHEPDAELKTKIKEKAAEADAAALVSPAALIPANNAEADELNEAEAVSAVVAPIMLGSEKIGTFQLYRSAAEQQDGQPAAWTEKELAFIEAVLDQVAQTAENMRLFDETRERAAREQTIREITDKLRTSPNLDILLETAARELGSRLGVRHTVIELGIDASAKPANGRPNAD